MEGVSSDVAIGENPRLTIAVHIEATCAEYLFVEKRDQLDGMRRRAITAIVILNWVCDVVLMIYGIEIDTIPAGRKENLPSDAIRTIGSGKSRSLLAVNSWIIIVQANPGNSLVAE
jgi:hypothetical protein